MSNEITRVEYIFEGNPDFNKVVKRTQLWLKGSDKIESGDIDAWFESILTEPEYKINKDHFLCISCFLFLYDYIKKNSGDRDECLKNIVHYFSENDKYHPLQDIVSNYNEYTEGNKKYAKDLYQKYRDEKTCKKSKDFKENKVSLKKLFPSDGTDEEKVPPTKSESSTESKEEEKTKPATKSEEEVETKSATESEEEVETKPATESEEEVETNSASELVKEDGKENSYFKNITTRDMIYFVAGFFAGIAVLAVVSFGKVIIEDSHTRALPPVMTVSSAIQDSTSVISSNESVYKSTEKNPEEPSSEIVESLSPKDTESKNENVKGNGLAENVNTNKTEKKEKKKPERGYVEGNNAVYIYKEPDIESIVEMEIVNKVDFKLINRVENFYEIQFDNPLSEIYTWGKDKVIASDEVFKLKDDTSTLYIEAKYVHFVE